MHPTTEYFAPVWCRSAHTHLIDPVINDALRISTGCLRHTPADNLLILTDIQPVELCRKGATLSLAPGAMEPGHLLHSALIHPSSANARRLKSRHPFVPATQQLISSSDNNNIIYAAHWVDHQCNAKWTDNPTRLLIYFHPRHRHPPGVTLARKAWVWLICLHTSVRRFRSCLCKSSMASFEACECGAEEQTVEHVVLQCPIHRPPHGLHGLTVLDDKTIAWLLNTCLEI